MIERRHGTSINPPKPKDASTSTQPSEEQPSEEHEYHDEVDEDQTLHETPDTEDIVDSTGKVLNQQPLYDKLINAEILLPHGDKMQMAKVIGRTVGDHGYTMGSYDDNPLLNSIIYDVEFPLPIQLTPLWCIALSY